MEILEHRLQSDKHKITHSLTECLSKPPEFKSDHRPDAIIIHYTAMHTVDGAIRALSKYKEGGRNASAHLVIGKKGEIYQLAPFNYKTWHAGTSSYNGRSGYNNFAIGIEIDNLGWLESFENGKFYSRPELHRLYKVEIPQKDVIQKMHRNPKYTFKYWQKYTREQIEVVKEICETITDTYKIKEILGHDEIAPDRKSDPGPDFPIEWLRNQVLYSDREDPDSLEPDVFEPYIAKISAGKLNIRIGPGTNEEKIAKPLLQGTKVMVLEKSGEWVKVRTEIEGWVHSNYIKA
jgi:N-acetylmuramoyl-L-alanine amidase